MMTYNNIITLFQSIATAHKQIKGFGTGPLFEINGEIKPGLEYPLLWVTTIDSQTLDQTKQRRFNIVLLDLVEKDLSNRDEVWSDTEQIIDDVIKIFRNESDSYDLIGEPILLPFTEQHGDWLTGWGADLVLQTEFNSNYCDVPADGFHSPVLVPGYGVIKNIETGEVIKTLKKGEVYYIEILDTIEQSLGNVTPTIIQVLS